MGHAQRQRYTFTLHFALCTLHFADSSATSPLQLKLVFAKANTSPMRFFVKPIARAITAKVKQTFIGPRFAQNLNDMQSERGKTAWFAGSHRVGADVQMSFVLQAIAARGGEFSMAR